MLTATVIAAGWLDDRLVEQVLDGNVAGARFERWVDEGDAALISLPDETVGIYAPVGVDLIVQDGEPFVRRLLVADMDSTIIGQECIDELADYAGCKSEVSDITERAMRGELDFAAALELRVALLKGLDEAVIGQCLAERIRVNPGAETLVRTMRSKGAETILVSGGFTAFVAPIAEDVGFDRFEANVLTVSRGKLAGTTEGRIVDAAVKRQVLIEARERLCLAAGETMAIGDGANDKLMVEEAGLGVAFRAKPALAEIADAGLNHNDLSALLWAQGIPRSEWVTA